MSASLCREKVETNLYINVSLALMPGSKNGHRMGLQINKVDTSGTEDSVFGYKFQLQMQIKVLNESNLLRRD